jgi:REP element-mobilizing transposase RayT
MLQGWWDKLPHKFPNLELDEFVVMPNHIHGILVLKDPGGYTGPPLQHPAVRADLRVGPGIGPRVGPPTPASLPTIIQWFKTMTTNAYIRGVKGSGWKPFPGKLWHRTYYEHIIRDDRDWARIRQYIRDNPLNWALDRNNPSNKPDLDIDDTGDDLKNAIS